MQIGRQTLSEWNAATYQIKVDSKAFEYEYRVMEMLELYDTGQITGDTQTRETPPTLVRRPKDPTVFDETPEDTDKENGEAYPIKWLRKLADQGNAEGTDKENGEAYPWKKLSETKLFKSFPQLRGLSATRLNMLMLEELEKFRIRFLWWSVGMGLMLGSFFLFGVILRR